MWLKFNDTSYYIYYFVWLVILFLISDGITIGIFVGLQVGSLEAAFSAAIMFYIIAAFLVTVVIVGTGAVTLIAFFIYKLVVDR